MKRKILTEYSDLELQKAIKSRKIYFVLFCIASVIIAMISIKDLLNGKFKTSTLIPLVFLPILVKTWTELTNAKEELANRINFKK